LFFPWRFHYLPYVHINGHILNWTNQPTNQ
jgi:hypothetical protein